MKHCVLRDSEKLKSAINWRIKQKGLRTNEVARLAGITPSMLSKWKKHGMHVVSQAAILKLCTALGIEVDLVIKFVD